MNHKVGGRAQSGNDVLFIEVSTSTDQQTGLLALTATIEAERAERFAFAVAADDVKEPAKEILPATEESGPPTSTELVGENRKLKTQISDLKSSAGQRQKAEERLRAVIESAPNAMRRINPHGRIVLVNAQLEVMLGYSSEEFLGKQLEVLVPERHRPPADGKEYSDRQETRRAGVGRGLFGIRNDGLEFPIN